MGLPLAELRARLRAYVRDSLFDPLEPHPDLCLVLQGERAPDAETVYGALPSAADHRHMIELGIAPPPRDDNRLHGERVLGHGPNRRDRTLATVLSLPQWRAYLEYLAHEESPLTFPHQTVARAYHARLLPGDKQTLLELAHRRSERDTARKYRLTTHSSVQRHYNDALDRLLAALLKSAARQAVA